MRKKSLEMRVDQRRQRRRPGGGRKKIERNPNYAHLRHPFQPQKIFTEDEVAAIHDTALRTLEELGMKVLLPEARDLFAQAGAIVHDDGIVRIGRDIVEQALSTTPKSYKLRGTSAHRDQMYENGSMLFSAGAGCPNATDCVRGRRPGSLNDYNETLKLQQSFDVIHLLGPSAEPQDVPVHLRHYEMMKSQLSLSDKPVQVYSRGRLQVQQSFEMLRLAHGMSEHEFTQDVWAHTIINTNSPRLLDMPMAEGIIDFARASQLTIITPFCLAGAMAPVTVAGALTLQHAESLAGITLAQIAKTGAPVSYGGFSSNVDMKSGSPAFGTPEHIKLQLGSGQLARHIGLPWRTAAGSASNAADMQAATENNMGLWASINANATLTLHAAGWLEGGLVFSYEKFINDVEALQTLAELCTKTKANAAEIGFDALQEVDPAGHFFSTAHTMERYQTAFYEPLVTDLQNFGAWEEAGSKTSTERSTLIWQDILQNFQAPSHSGSAVEALSPYIEKMSKAGGAPPLA
jgi:trimethylamine--corrinoid protein Co-methyltransferase